MAPPFLPLGKVQMFSVETPHVIATGDIVNPRGPLRLGGYTDVSGASSYLLIEGKTDGVHLNEPNTNKVIFDTPLATTQPFQAVSVVSTGNGSFGGDLTIAGTTAMRAIAVAGDATFASSVDVTGPVTAQAVTVSGATELQGNAVVGGQLSVAGAVTFQQTLNCGPLTAASATVTDDLKVGAGLSSQTLTVAQAGSFGSLSVTGNSALNTLSTLGTATFGAGVSVASALTVGSGLTVAGPDGITVTAGNLAIAGASFTAGPDTVSVAVGGTTALTIDSERNLVVPVGGVFTKSVTGLGGQPLTLKGTDASGTVHIAGNLVIDGDWDTAQKVEMQVEDTIITLAHSQTSPQPDSVADGAGIEIEGNSGYAKSITWKNNLGLGYKGSSGAVSTEDGLSYFQVQGGNLVLTRTIPAANHNTRNSVSGQWTPDSQQTVVSYAFRIDDRENLQIAKTQGTDYSSPATNGNYNAVGGTAVVCGSYEVSSS